MIEVYVGSLGVHGKPRIKESRERLLSVGPNHHLRHLLIWIPMFEFEEFGTNLHYVAVADMLPSGPAACRNLPTLIENPPVVEINLHTDSGLYDHARRGKYSTKLGQHGNSPKLTLDPSIQSEAMSSDEGAASQSPAKHTH
jgi:hypothetical protein